MKMAAAAAAVVGEEYCSEGERELTVRKASVFFPGDGYAAYDHRTGDLVFRVDAYAFADRHRRHRLHPHPNPHPHPLKQLVLMDPHGASILTLRRKWPSLHQRWEGFKGERVDGQRPLFTVRRSSIFGGDRGGVSVDVHAAAEAAAAAAEYRIEGSFAQRCCRVLCGGGGIGGREGNEMAAEIKRKVDSCAHVDVVLGKDVFSLCLAPRFDSAFAMALVLVLDQISRDDDDDDDAAAAAADYHHDRADHDADAVSVPSSLLVENDGAVVSADGDAPKS